MGARSAALAGCGVALAALLFALALPLLRPLLPPLLAGAAGAAATAPPLCAGMWSLWRRWDLPECNGNVAKVERRLLQASCASLGLHCLCALFSGPVVRFLLLAYSVAGAMPLLYRALPLGLQRMWSNLVEVLPIVWHYLAKEEWAKAVGVSKEVLTEYSTRLDEKYAPQLSGLMVKQGGLYVKIGQLLSIFPPGVFPQAYMDEFTKMQGEVSAMKMDEVREVLEAAYGTPLEEVFSTFQETPLGAASVGQVHLASLASDGREVAVKVQRPGMPEGVWADYWTLRLVARLFIKELRPVTRHFKDWIERELNFEMEARALRRVHENLRETFPKVLVPKPVEELCRREVVVMSFVPGVSLLQALLRMATVILGESGRKALEGLLSDERVLEEETSVAASRTAQGAAACGALGASLGTLLLAWRRRRGLLRALKRGLLASGALAVLAVAAKRAMRGSQPNMLDLVLPSRATLMRLLQHGMASARSATNVGISAYNRAAGVVGAKPLKLRKEIPKFDPVGVAFELWKVQGHQLLTDGFFNTDTHPGNFLIDESTGSISLIDFGQACELPVRMRVLVARQVVALADGDEREIAMRHAHLGYRSKRMAVVTLAASARVKFGQMTVQGLESILKHFDKLKKWDPVTEPANSENMLLDRMVALLRGTTGMLGAPLDQCCPSEAWAPMARAVLAKHGAEVEEPDFSLSDELPVQGHEIG